MLGPSALGHLWKAILTHYNVIHSWHVRGPRWSHRGDYILAKHDVTIAAANSALRDPERVVIEPDDNSKSGETVRIVGYSTVHGAVLTIIALRHEDGVEYGVNCWVSNIRDRRIYREGE